MGSIWVREAGLGDVTAIARVRVETWQSAYRGIVPQDYLDSLSVEQVAARWGEMMLNPSPGSFNLVAETESGDGQKEIVGIAMAGPEREQDAEYRGGVYVLYVLPGYQKQGIGRKLVAACARRLLQNGIDSLLIWVIRDNPYRKFYESLGGVVVREKDQETGGKLIREVGYGWKDMRGLCAGMEDLPEA